jgi:hypothetical protein
MRDFPWMMRSAGSLLQLLRELEGNPRRSHLASRKFGSNPGMPVALFGSRFGTITTNEFCRSNNMADAKQKAQDAIDNAAEKAKDVTGKAVDKTKEAARNVGQKIEDAGNKLKKQGS